MSDETPVLERLEKLVQYIENMLDKPYLSRSPYSAEERLLTAFELWAILLDSKLSVHALWKEEIKLAWPDRVGGFSNTCLATGCEGRHSEGYNRVTDHMRRIWNQLKHTK